MPVDQNLDYLSAEHFPKLRPGAQLIFLPDERVWKVVQVIERGVVLYRADDESHLHLAEWQELATAKTKTAKTK